MALRDQHAGMQLQIKIKPCRSRRRWDKVVGHWPANINRFDDQCRAGVPDDGRDDARRPDPGRNQPDGSLPPVSVDRATCRSVCNRLQYAQTTTRAYSN
jgi:hypothetical protein